jgi:dihydroorotase
MRGFPISAEVLGVLRALVLARETNCAVHLTHVSTAAALEAIRAAKADGVDVTCDVTPHHLVLSEEDVLRSNLNAAFKVNPPLRSAADRDALWRGIADGTVDAIATDHAPWHEDEKDLPFQEANFGIASYECAVGAVLDYRRNAEPEVPLERLLALWTSRPGALLPQGAAFPGDLRRGFPPM